jgi:hypothetical protein
MSITSEDNYWASVRRRFRLVKNATRTTVAGMPFTTFDLAGAPGTGVLAGTNTANGGVLQTGSMAGYPNIAFSSGQGYLTRVEFGSTVASRLNLFDVIVKMGAISYAAATTTPTVDSQPNISARCPDYPGSGSAFGAGNELWIEVSTAFSTGNNWTVSITYRNQDGTSGRVATLSAVKAAADLTQGRWHQLTLQGTDSGVQRIEAVTVTNGSTAMTAGAFNILIARPLITNMRVRTAIDGGILDYLSTGASPVYSDSAIVHIIEADSTSAGYPEIMFEVANG